MSTFALEKWYQDSKCTIYSVRDDLDDVDSFTEADRFFEKFGKSKDEDILYAAQLILQFLTNEICKINGEVLEKLLPSHIVSHLSAQTPTTIERPRIGNAII